MGQGWVRSRARSIIRDDGATGSSPKRPPPSAEKSGTCGQSGFRVGGFLGLAWVALGVKFATTQAIPAAKRGTAHAG